MGSTRRIYRRVPPKRPSRRDERTQSPCQQRHHLSVSQAQPCLGQQQSNKSCNEISSCPPPPSPHHFRHSLLSPSLVFQLLRPSVISPSFSSFIPACPHLSSLPTGPLLPFLRDRRLQDLWARRPLPGATAPGIPRQPAGGCGVVAILLRPHFLGAFFPFQ